MDIETLYGFRIYIIESLPSDRLHTGLNLMHRLQELWTNMNCYDFDVKYYEAFDKNDLESTMSIILADVENDNYIPIIQIECHGQETGLSLSSLEDVTWGELFAMTRPINVASCNNLFLNLSMCYGAMIALCIEPKDRAPFRTVIGPLNTINEDVLEEAWYEFYTRCCNIGDATNKNILDILPLEFQFLDQELLFDMHYNREKLFPDLFKEDVMNELKYTFRNDMKESDPLILMLDLSLFEKRVRNNYRRFRERYKPYFCFWEDMESTARKDNQ